MSNVQISVSIGLILQVAFVVLVIASLISVLILVRVSKEILKTLRGESAVKGNASAAVDNTIAQIAQKEELVNDYELVAVITAAIAAYESASSGSGSVNNGAASANNFVVRSIKRVGSSNWKRA